MLYVKKRIPIDISEPWLKHGDNPNVTKATDMNFIGHIHCQKCNKMMSEHGWIDTLEGGHIVCPKDRIVTGVKGEKYPIKPDIFEETYEPWTEEMRK